MAASPPMSAWLAGPPTLRGEPDLQVALVDALLVLLAPYRLRSIWSGEPRTYRTGPRGRALLAEALAARRVRFLDLTTEPGASVGEATAFLDLDVGARPELAVVLGLQLWTTAGIISPAEVVAFMTRWFGALDAADAFVSDRLDDAPMGTRHEREASRTTLLAWPALRRYLRAVCWGNGLGPDLCARLGGRERVLREAPVPIIRPVGNGVWLQASVMPPGDPATLSALAAYLQPLLNWTHEDALAAEAADHATTGRATWELTPVPAVARPFEPAVRVRRKLVPVHRLGEIGMDLGLNVYLASSPTPEQQATIAAALAAWYAAGVDGAYGEEPGAGFLHTLTGPSVDVERAVMRWLVDLGSADDRRALHALRERLATLPGVEVARLVVGTEQAR